MDVDQRAVLRASDPLPPELVHRPATASRQITVHTCWRTALAEQPGGVVNRPRTGGTGDVSPTVAGPAIHSEFETVWLQCETGGRSALECPREEDSA
jgi:hypothetical protein